LVAGKLVEGNTGFAGSELTEILRRFEIEALSVLAERGSFAPLAVLCLDQTFTPLILDFETGESREASFGILQDAINLSRPEFAVLLAFEHIPPSGDAAAPWELHLYASIATPNEEVHECFRVEGPPSRLELVEVPVNPELLLLSRTMWSNPACDLH
jgi:hypothetical protein